MKKLTLSLTILLYAILAQSQTTVFNLGWNGTPEKILCAGDTWIVYAHESYGTGKDGKLIKYKRIGNEFEEIASLYVPEDLQDYRFVNGNLRVAAFRSFECDYPPKDLYYYEIDTATFRTTKYERIGEDLNLSQAGFATDSTIFLWTDDLFNDTLIYNINSGLKVNHDLSNFVNLGTDSDFVAPVFNDNLLYVHSAIFPMSFLIDPNVKNLPFGFFPSSLLLMSIPNHRAVYSFAQDSLCIITDNRVLKTDTAFRNHKTISIPMLPGFKLIDDKIFLFDDKNVQTYSLPNVTLISEDSLKGLPSGFEIKDVYPTNGNLSIVAHRSNSNPALNETVLKSDINSTNEVERNEIMLDSVTFVKADVTGLGQVNRYLIRATNHGQDTIKSFNVLFEHLENRQCFFYDHTTVRMPIPPGESKTFTKDVKVHRAGQVCFFASVPDGRLEDNLSDNSTCAYAWLSAEEVSNLGLVSIYPNPANRKLTIKGDLRDFKCLSVRSTDGRQMPIAVLSQNEESLSLDMTALNKGVYFLQMHIGEEVFTEKIVKE